MPGLAAALGLEDVRVLAVVVIVVVVIVVVLDEAAGGEGVARKGVAAREGEQTGAA